MKRKGTAYDMIIGAVAIILIIFLWIVFYEVLGGTGGVAETFNNMSGMTAGVISTNNSSIAVFYYSLLIFIIIILLAIVKSSTDKKENVVYAQ